MRNTHKIDELFRESFKDFSVEQRPSDWYQLDRQLDRNRKHKRTLFYWRAAAASFALLAVSGWMVVLLNSPKEIVVVQNTPTLSAPTVANASVVPSQTKVLQNSPSILSTTNAVPALKIPVQEIITPTDHTLKNIATSISVETNSVAASNNLENRVTHGNNLTATPQSDAIGTTDIFSEMTPSVSTTTPIEPVVLDLQAEVKEQTSETIAAVEPVIETQVASILPVQNEQPLSLPTETKNKFFVSVYGSTDDNQYTLNPLNNEGVEIYNATFDPPASAKYFKKDPYEVGQGTQYTFGALLGYTFNKNLSIETGLQYSKKRSINHSVTYTNVLEVSDSLGTHDEVTTNIYSAQYQSRFLEIPVRLRYTVGKGKVRFYTIAGVSTALRNFFQTNGFFNKTVYTDNTTEFTSIEQRKTNFNYQYGFGLTASLNRRFELFGGPMWTRRINTAYKDAPIDYTEKAFSLSGGIRYSF